MVLPHPADVEAVTFDLWATVLGPPERGARERHRERVGALRDVLARHGHPVEPRAIVAAMRAEWLYYESIWHGEQRTLLNAQRVAWLVEHLALPALPEEDVVRVAGAFDQSLWAGPPGLAPGARDVLEALASAGLKLGVISDTSFTTGRTLRVLLEREGVLGYFQAFAFSDEIGRSKPHPRAFELTLAELGVAPHQAVHVGDNPDTDVLGAKRAGMGSVLFRPDAPLDDPAPGAPDLVVAHFDELRFLAARRHP